VLVRIEVESDETVFSIVQEARLSRASFGQAEAAVLCLGRAAGQVIAALGASADVTLDVLIEEFTGAVVRSCRPAPTPHTRDGVGGC